MKPALIIVALILLALGGLTCAHKAAVWTDFFGKPLDYAGDWVLCPDCPASDNEPGTLDHVSGYTYKCKRCGLTAKVRRNPDTLGVLIERH